jgi:hypothetical protein
MREGPKKPTLLTLKHSILDHKTIKRREIYHQRALIRLRHGLSSEKAKQLRAKCKQPKILGIRNTKNGYIKTTETTYFNDLDGRRKSPPVQHFCDDGRNNNSPLFSVILCGFSRLYLWNSTGVTQPKSDLDPRDCH